jgi:hypothetical protein
LKHNTKVRETHPSPQGTMTTLLSSRGTTGGRTRWLLISWCEDADPKADPSPPPLIVQPCTILVPFLLLVFCRQRCPQAPQRLSPPPAPWPPPPPPAPSSPHPEKMKYKEISKFILKNGMKIIRLPRLSESRSLNPPKKGP